MIAIDPREPNFTFVTRGGAMTGVYHNVQPELLQLRTMAQKKASFDVQKKKQAFLDVRPEFADAQQPSTSYKVRDMPERFQQIFQK